MNEKTAYEVFFRLHSNLPREGPGDNAATTKAFNLLPSLPAHPHILDLGCGPGMQTVQLAKLTDGVITAVDLHQPYLDQLQQSLAQESLQVQQRVKLLNADMETLDCPAESTDLVWAEGSAYILEFSHALRTWRSLLTRPGYLVASEISWLRKDPPAEVVNFWQEEYPNLQSVEGNLAMIKNLGYVAIAHFILPESAWWENYYDPLEQRLQDLASEYAGNPDAQQVLDSHRHEIALFQKYSAYYGYVFYILQVDQLANIYDSVALHQQRPRQSF